MRQNQIPKSRNLQIPKTGFTLVELLVVITIIGILIALLLPAVQAAREAARRMQCGNQFKQVALALHNYHAAIGSFPPGIFNELSEQYPTAPRRFAWSVYILPYLEMQSLYDMFDFNQPSIYYNKAGHTLTIPKDPANTNWVASGTYVPAYLCPSDPLMGVDGLTANTTVSTTTAQTAMSNICGVTSSRDYREQQEDGGIGEHGYSNIWDFPRNDGIFGGNVGCRIADIKDGTSNTFLICEVASSNEGRFHAHNWASLNLTGLIVGINGPSTVPGGSTGVVVWFNRPASFHPGGCHFAMADGSVGFVSQNTAQYILYALATRDGANRWNYHTTLEKPYVPESSVNGFP